MVVYPRTTSSFKANVLASGNPGLASYYEEYMLQVRRDLSQLTEAEPPHIWAVSHVGHDLPEELEMPKLKGETVANHSLAAELTFASVL